MQFDFMDDERERKGFMLAIGVIILGIVSIAAFMIFGNSLIFYVIAIVTLAVEFYMARHISRSPAAAEPEAKPEAKPARKRSGKR